MAGAAMLSIEAVACGSNLGGMTRAMVSEVEVAFFSVSMAFYALQAWLEEGWGTGSRWRRSSWGRALECASGYHVSES